MKKLKKVGIVDLVDEKTLCHYQNGDFIIEQGEEINCIQYIKEGKAKIVHKNSSGKEFTFLQVQTGEYIGIHSLLTKEKSFVSVIAVDPVVVYKIKEESLNNSMNKWSEISFELIKHLCSKIGLVESKISETVPKRIKIQLAKILLSSKKAGVKSENNISYSISELASIVGTTKNYIYHILTEFQRLQILSIKDSEVRILDERKLEKFVQSINA